MTLHNICSSCSLVQPTRCLTVFWISHVRWALILLIWNTSIRHEFRTVQFTPYLISYQLFNPHLLKHNDQNKFDTQGTICIRKMSHVINFSLPKPTCLCPQRSDVYLLLIKWIRNLQQTLSSGFRYEITFIAFRMPTSKCVSLNKSTCIAINNTNEILEQTKCFKGLWNDVVFQLANPNLFRKSRCSLFIACLLCCRVCH
jgi:hypothetical protein